MSEFELEYAAVKVVYFYDEDTKLYSLSLLEHGGPVIVSPDLESAKKEMNEALNFAFTLRNLQYFDDISVANRVRLNRSNTSPKHEVEYVQLVG